MYIDPFIFYNLYHSQNATIHHSLSERGIRTMAEIIRHITTAK